MSKEPTLLLSGLDGANPLGFLSALGALRTLTLAMANQDVVRMSWVLHGGAWRPGLHDTPADEATVVKLLQDALEEGDPALDVADDLTIAPEDFRLHARQAIAGASQHARSTPDLLASFGTEAFIDDSGKSPSITDTSLRTMSGAGHQHFLAYMRNIVQGCGPGHLQKALFSPWQYDDPVKNMTLRWDPVDDGRYALRWRNPSVDPSRAKSGSMWGAYRLAIEALPLLPVIPAARGARTVGFTGRGSRDTYWTWPVWDVPLALDPCRSLLASPAVRGDDHGACRALGVAGRFRVQRITVGKYRSFTPARAI